MKVYLEVYPDCVEVCAPDMPHGFAYRYRHLRDDWSQSTAAQGTIRKDLQDAYSQWCGGYGQTSPADHEIVIVLPEVTARQVALTEEFKDYVYRDQTGRYDINSPDNPNRKYGLTARFYGHEIRVIPTPQFSELFGLPVRYDPPPADSKDSYIPSGEFPGVKADLWTTALAFGRQAKLFVEFEKAVRPLYEKHPAVEKAVREVGDALTAAHFPGSTGISGDPSPDIRKDLTAAAKSIEEVTRTTPTDFGIFVPPPPGKKFVLNEKHGVELADDPDADPQPTIVNGET